MINRKNADIYMAISARCIQHKQVAKEMGINPTSLSRLLRKDLSIKNRARIYDAINKLAPGTKRESYGYVTEEMSCHYCSKITSEKHRDLSEEQKSIRIFDKIIKTTIQAYIEKPETGFAKLSVMAFPDGINEVEIIEFPVYFCPICGRELPI